MKNDYNKCLTNLACSVQNYFGVKPKHKTLKVLDNILEEEKPKKVVVILFDGLGYNILNRTLPEDSFLRKNLKDSIFSVFPATTTAAETTVRTGLNPIEHGWLGWTVYFKPIDKVIIPFRKTEKGKEETCKEFQNVEPFLVSRTIVDDINEAGKKAAIISNFGGVPYENLDDMLEKIKTSEANYIYAYDVEPDNSMHDLGINNDRVKQLILERSEKLEQLCKDLKDTLLIVVADHGHLEVDNVFLHDYPELLALLERTTSLEQRTVSFKVKPEKYEEFKQLFNNLFGNDFTLYGKNEIIESKLFGDGEPNPLFEDALGDFIAIAENSDKTLVMDDEYTLVSTHGGYSDDEILVPLIIKMCK